MVFLAGEWCWAAIADSLTIWLRCHVYFSFLPFVFSLYYKNRKTFPQWISSSFPSIGSYCSLFSFCLCIVPPCQNTLAEQTVSDVHQTWLTLLPALQLSVLTNWGPLLQIPVVDQYNSSRAAETAPFKPWWKIYFMLFKTKRQLQLSLP